MVAHRPKSATSRTSVLFLAVTGYTIVHRMHSNRARLSSLALGLLLAATLVAPVAAAGDRFRGRLVQFHGDDRSMTRTVTSGYALESGGRTYKLSFRDAGLARLVGRNVELTGTRHGRSITVAGYRAAPDAGASTDQTSTAAATNKNLAVLLINFRDTPTEPYTPAFAGGVMFSDANSVANYFAEQSYGQMAVTGQVFGWYTIDYDNTGCSYTPWATAARAAATAAGVDLNGFTNIVYSFTAVPGCSWAGVAYLPGSESFLNNAMNLRVATHELSHNFGVHHASTYDCVSAGVRVAISASASDCSINEYGDPFTVMGSSQTRHSHAWHKAQMGWLGGANDRLNVSVAGSYSLGAQEVGSATPKVIRIARTGASGKWFYLEFRQPFGSYFDNFLPTNPAVMGVSVRVGPDYPTRDFSWLVDTTPATASWSDAALAVGRSFDDPLSGVSVTTQSAGPAGAVVLIGFSGSDRQAPTSPSNLQANATGSNSIVLSWGAATDDRFVAGYRVSRNGTVVGTAAGTSWNDGGLLPNTTYGYSVVAYDYANNASLPASVQATTARDTQAPTAPANLRATVAKGGATKLSWNAATDNTAVTGYRVFRNSTQFATTSGTSWTAKKARGTWTWHVVAFDQAGNVSGASNSVTVTVR